MESYPEPLEQAFQRVEEECKRRAQQEEEWAKPQRSNSEIPSVIPKDRRRGSVSISKLGELAPGGVSELASNVPPASNRSSMAPTSKADFYQAQMSHSIDSFSSAHLGEDAKTEEDHITQVQYVNPQPTPISKAVGNLLPRRLSRARSATVVSSLQDSNVVIGVSVEEATAEAQEGHSPVAGAKVYGPGGPKLGSLPGRWVGRAKSLTQKFRRRSAGPFTKDPS
ncbi:hypothetical protein ONZ45_g15945 [Pleurotus djamor]|nr:hypothetical protein ONZ45_g15945 [Pleurotus djamor]